MKNSHLPGLATRRLKRASVRAAQISIIAIASLGAWIVVPALSRTSEMHAAAQLPAAVDVLHQLRLPPTVADLSPVETAVLTQGAAVARALHVGYSARLSVGNGWNLSDRFMEVANNPREGRSMLLSSRCDRSGALRLTLTLSDSQPGASIEDRQAMANDWAGSPKFNWHRPVLSAGAQLELQETSEGVQVITREPQSLLKPPYFGRIKDAPDRRSLFEQIAPEVFSLKCEGLTPSGRVSAEESIRKVLGQQATDLMFSAGAKAAEGTASLAGLGLSGDASFEVYEAAGKKVLLTWTKKAPSKSDKEAADRAFDTLAAQFNEEGPSVGRTRAHAGAEWRLAGYRLKDGSVDVTAGAELDEVFLRISWKLDRESTVSAR